MKRQTFDFSSTMRCSQRVALLIFCFGAASCKKAPDQVKPPPMAPMMMEDEKIDLGDTTKQAELTGRIMLPPMHIRNIGGKRLIPRRLATMPCAFADTEGHLHTDIEQAERDRIRTPNDLQLNRLLTVHAFPARPPSKDAMDVRFTFNKEEFPVDKRMYHGTIDARGVYRISVPPYPYGYYIAVNGGNVRMKRRFDEVAKGGEMYRKIDVGIQDTLIANVSHMLGDGALQLNNAAIKEALGAGVALYQSNIMRRSAKHLHPRAWNILAREILLNSSLAPNGLTTFTAADSPAFALMSASEITDRLPAARYTTMNFDQFKDDQRVERRYGMAAGIYLNATDGGEFDGSLGRPASSNQVKETVGEALLIQDIDESDGAENGLQITFGRATGLIRSIGLEIQNGSSHGSTDSSSARRGFRFEAYNLAGDLLEEYHWYTSQGSAGPSYYGLTSDEPIFAINIRMIGKGDFTVDKLSYSSIYLTAIRDALGWRSTGTWALRDANTDPPGNTSAPGVVTTNTGTVSFDHFDRKTTNPAKLGMGAATTCDFSGNYSGGKYWLAGYPDGTNDHADSNGSVLIAPAYTLTNLALDNDDQYSFDYWISGTLEGLEEKTTENINQCTEAENYYHGRNRIQGNFLPDSSEYEDAFSSGDKWDYCCVNKRDPNLAFVGSDDGSSGTIACDWHRYLGTGTGHTTCDPDDAAYDATTTSTSWATVGVETMRVHWGHVHWQSWAVVDDASLWTNSSQTERYVEYSTDNGATWNEAWWYNDANHRSNKNNIWWSDHMHPFPDSDIMAFGEHIRNYQTSSASLAGSLIGYLSDQSAFSNCVNTDFDKDGIADFNVDIDGDGQGAADGDVDDCRQWNTEFYMDVPGDYYDETITDVSQNPSLIEGVTILYRFRFNSNGISQGINDGTCSDENGVSTECLGWAVDDVAINNDDEDVGLYTDFEYFEVPSD